MNTRLTLARALRAVADRLAPAPAAALVWVTPRQVRRAERALEQHVVHLRDANSLPHPAPAQSVAWGIYPGVYRQN